MHSILFSIGPFHVYGYGFMIAVGIICAFTIGCFLAKCSGLDDDALFSMGLVGDVYKRQALYRGTTAGNGC